MYNVFIGIDLGAKAGISVIRGDIMLSHEVKFGGKEEPLRYKKFWDHICEIFDAYEDYQPIVFYEYVARHLGTKAAHAYGAYRMILLMACHDRGIPCKELSVQAIKKAATGKGAAKKDIMIESATNRFKVDWKLTDTVQEVINIKSLESGVAGSCIDNGGSVVAVVDLCEETSD